MKPSAIARVPRFPRRLDRRPGCTVVIQETRDCAVTRTRRHTKFNLYIAKYRTSRGYVWVLSVLSLDAVGRPASRVRRDDDHDDDLIYVKVLVTFAPRCSPTFSQVHCRFHTTLSLCLLARMRTFCSFTKKKKKSRVTCDIDRNK